MVERKLSEQDMIDILEEIAAEGGNAAARIAAIKTLREIDAGETPAAEGFARLDEYRDGRNYRAKSA